jgi:hypothetical protein
MVAATMQFDMNAASTSYQRAGQGRCDIVPLSVVEKSHPGSAMKMIMTRPIKVSPPFLHTDCTMPALAGI